MDTKDRFDTKTAKVSGCMEWQASKNDKGYGWFGIDGKVMLAHRVAWELENGPIPEGMLVCHRCDNPSCVDVSHLFLGTHKDNSQDMVRKGRSSRAVSRAKVTQFDADEMRRRAADGEDTSLLAGEYGISPAYITAILRGERWGENKYQWPLPRINQDQVKRLFEITGNQSEVARMLGINSGTVSRIVRNAYPS